MAERRRRRSTECDSETEHAEPVLSEYDSTADESRVTETETESDEYITEEEETAEEEEDEEDGKEVDGERQSGDGEEQPKLDDDEDRQNPAYIPRRGAFYEHDMRMDPDEEVDESGNQGRDEKRGKGKLWKDESKSKWVHDKFDSYDQAPKSRQELIAMYGYDITQFDEPPDEAPKTGGRPRRGGRDRKPQFQDFLPDSGKDKRNYGNRDSYDDDFRGPRKSKSDSTQYRGSSRGRRGRGGRSDGGPSRRNYSDIKDDRNTRNRSYSDRERDFRGQDNYNDRNDFRGRDNYEDRERGNFGKRGRGGFSNDNQYERDNNRDRGYGNRGNRGQYDNQDDRGPRSPDNNNRPSFRGGPRGGRGRGRGDPVENRRDNRRDYREDNQSNEGRSNRDRGNYDRKYSGPRDPEQIERQTSGGRDREHYERQNSGGRDRQNYDRQSSAGHDNEGQVRKQNEGRGRTEPEPSQQEYSSRRYSGSEPQSRIPTRSYNKPTPKSYYTLSVTDDEKLTGDMDDGEYSPPVKGGISDLNVTVTGDKRSFKDRPRQQRPQDYVPSSGNDDRREPPASHGTGPQSKHQPTLPPRLQQQQQQERKRQQKQQLQQNVSAEKQQDTSQGRSNKRYSSQRQRALPEGPGFTEPQISQSQQPISTSQIQQQFQPNFSPTKPAGVQPSVIVRPAISQQISAPPRQPSVGSPTMVFPGVPPPASMIPVPGQVPQARPQRPPPPAGPQQMGSPPVFATGTMPSTAMPAVSVIGAPLINPAGMIYAAPPPTFQVPVPQFTGAAAAAQQTQQPGETVRGGTTYYSQATAGTGATPGTTYYSPEMQMSKQNRVQVRRPKVPLPIVNPEDVKKEKGSESTPRGDDDQYIDDNNEAVDVIESVDTKHEHDDNTGELDDDDVVYSNEDAISEQINPNVDVSGASNDNNTAGDVSVAPSDDKTVNVKDEAKVEIADKKEELVSTDNVNNSVEKTETIDSENTTSAEKESNSKTETSNRPTELEIVADTSKLSKDDSNVVDERSSTIVVKTEVLTPTLSVSTSVKPEKTDNSSNSNTEAEKTNAIQAVDKKTTEVNEDKVAETGNQEKEENDDFEDAVENKEINRTLENIGVRAIFCME
ncbi:nuclear-transcribed mRNA catabolic process [Mactra antiquata]